MKLSEVKKVLETINDVNFRLPNGKIVPEHFHVTEVGEITKHFIDCGGTVRHEKVVNFQLWEAGDLDHRLKPEKLSKIISISEQKLGIGDSEIEVEYQSDTIGKYDLSFDGKDFILLSKHTNCLASDKCGIPQEKQKVSLSSFTHEKKGGCSPGGGCC